MPIARSYSKGSGFQRVSRGHGFYYCWGVGRPGWDGVNIRMGLESMKGYGSVKKLPWRRT